MFLAFASLLVDPAAACTRLWGGAHEIVENPADTTAPSAPTGLEFLVTRATSPVCVGPVCGHDSCADDGVITVIFGAAEDDVSAVEAVGYRLRVVDGTPPERLTVERTQRADTIDDLGNARIGLVWADDGESGFDFTLGITAIDEAGNESEEVEVLVSDAGTGCATVTGAGALATLLALGLAGARRRR